MAANDLTIYLLDMGEQIYGDCLLCLAGGKTILIDGGHQKDFTGQPGYDSIPTQLSGILEGPPFSVDLLVVTHCHTDHIGCLPEMIAAKQLAPKWALVADEDLGFGSGTGPDALAFDRAPTALQQVVAALREESAESLSDAELQQFLADAVTLESRYRSMLKALDRNGTRIVRYGRNKTDALMSAFAGTGLKILGPTKAHLEICAEAIRKAKNDALDAAEGFVADAPGLGPVALYRTLARGHSTDALDRPGLGAALNDQSIVLSLGKAGNTALLTGDMQFAKPKRLGSVTK